MRRFAARTVLAIAAAVPLCLAAAAPVAAAPGDVSYDATTAGGSITSTFTNSTDSLVGCAFAGFEEPYEPADQDWVFNGYVEVPAGESGSQTIDGLAVGQELYLEWLCLRQADVIADQAGWGTVVEPSFNMTAPTAERTAITVGGTVESEPVEEMCTGSVCLPTGSFGF